MSNANDGKRRRPRRQPHSTTPADVAVRDFGREMARNLQHAQRELRGMGQTVGELRVELDALATIQKDLRTMQTTPNNPATPNNTNPAAPVQQPAAPVQQPAAPEVMTPDAMLATIMGKIAAEGEATRATIQSANDEIAKVAAEGVNQVRATAAKVNGNYENAARYAMETFNDRLKGLSADALIDAYVSDPRIVTEPAQLAEYQPGQVIRVDDPKLAARLAREGKSVYKRGDYWIAVGIGAATAIALIGAGLAIAWSLGAFDSADGEGELSDELAPGELGVVNG